MVKKVNSRLKFLYRQVNDFNQNVKKMICSALVLCPFDFSISVWYGGISKYHARRLQCAQNKVIRFILNKDFIYHIDHADFKSLGILNINTRAEQLRLNRVFNIFFMIPVLPRRRKTLLGCQTYIVIIQGEVISISKFQELKHTVLDANTPPPAANPRSEQNTNTGSFELWAL